MIIQGTLVCRWRLGRWSLNDDDDDDDVDCIGVFQGVFGVSIYWRIGVFDKEQLTWCPRLRPFRAVSFWGDWCWRLVWDFDG